MQESAIQILEVRAGYAERSVTITAAVSAEGSDAVFAALSEQLDRRRAEPTLAVEEVLALREQAALLERFEPLARAGASGVVSLSDSDLRSCLLELSDYAARVDGDHFQPLELRERIAVIAEITAVLWDANAHAAAAAEEALTHAAP
jgi:hypothetical protein